MNIKEREAAYKAEQEAKAAAEALRQKNIADSNSAWDAYMVASNAERAAEDAWDAEIKAGVVNNGPAEAAYLKANKAADKALRVYNKACNYIRAEN